MNKKDRAPGPESFFPTREEMGDRQRPHKRKRREQRRIWSIECPDSDIRVQGKLPGWPGLQGEKS